MYKLTGIVTRKCWMFWVVTCCTISFNFLHAQHESEEHEGTEKGIYEVIATTIYAYSPEHESGTWGNEFHFTYWFDHTYGTGASYTLKYEEDETLHDIALLGSWNPTRWITLNLGPNFALPGEHRDFSVLLYAEAEINVRLKEWFHIGPVLGTLLGNSSEISGGFHIGFEF